jgi:hypothetical protein
VRGKDDDALSSYISKAREMRSAFNALVQWRYVPDPEEQEQRQNEVGAGKEELGKAKEGLAKAIKERDEARIALVALQQQDNSDASTSADAQQQRDSEAIRELDRLLGSLREGSEAGLFAAGMRPGASSSKGEMQTRNLGMVEGRCLVLVAVSDVGMKGFTCDHSKARGLRLSFHCHQRQENRLKLTITDMLRASQMLLRSPNSARTRLKRR